MAIRLLSVRAGSLPLPVLQVADELADACRKIRLPIRWTEDQGKPVALLDIQSTEPVYVDAIQLEEGQLYVAGHTDPGRVAATASNAERKSPTNPDGNANMDDYELRLAPSDEHAGLEIARRHPPKPASKSVSTHQ